MKLGCLLSRNHRKTGLVDLLRVTNPSFAVNSTTPLDFRASGLSGAGLVLICCKVGFENNLEKLQEGGVSPHANTGRHVPPDQARFYMRMRMRRSQCRGRGTPGLLLRISVA